MHKTAPGSTSGPAICDGKNAKAVRSGTNPHTDAFAPTATPTIGKFLKQNSLKIKNTLTLDREEDDHMNLIKDVFGYLEVEQEGGVDLESANWDQQPVVTQDKAKVNALLTSGPLQSSSNGKSSHITKDQQRPTSQPTHAKSASVLSGSNSDKSHFGNVKELIREKNRLKKVSAMKLNNNHSNNNSSKPKVGFVSKSKSKVTDKDMEKVYRLQGGGPDPQTWRRVLHSETYRANCTDQVYVLEGRLVQERKLLAEQQTERDDFHSKPASKLDLTPNPDQHNRSFLNRSFSKLPSIQSRDLFIHNIHSNPYFSKNIIKNKSKKKTNTTKPRSTDIHDNELVSIPIQE